MNACFEYCYQNLSPCCYFFSPTEPAVKENTELQRVGIRRSPSAGKTYCCVPFCHNYETKTLDDGTRVVLHRLPSATRYPNTWELTLQKLREINPHLKENSDSTRICSVHFEGVYVQGESIPTIFPSEPPVSEIATNGERRKRRLRTGEKHYCCVPYCQNYYKKVLEDGSQVVMHRLPSASAYPETRRLTIQKLKELNPRLNENSDRTRICSAHYEGPYIQGESVPTTFPVELLEPVVEHYIPPLHVKQKDELSQNMGPYCLNESGRSHHFIASECFITIAAEIFSGLNLGLLGSTEVDLSFN